MARTVDSFKKLKRQLEIAEKITKENLEEISQEYGLSINTVRMIYFKSKNKEKMTELKARIKEYKKNYKSFTQKDIDEEVKYIILQYENENRDIKEISKLLNRDFDEIERILNRRYKNKTGLFRKIRELI